MGPLSIRIDRFQEVDVKYVREGSMAQIMAESRNGHIVDIILIDFKFRLLF